MTDHTNHWGHKIRRILLLERLPAPARKIAVGIVGLTIVALGLLMIVFPGPAILVIPLGILLLGTEFVWADKLGTRLQARFRRVKENWRTRKGPPPAATIAHGNRRD